MTGSGEVDETPGQATDERSRTSPTLEKTPHTIVIGIALALSGGVLWGVNATVSKILMDSYSADPLWIACVREFFAGIIFLACSAVLMPKQLVGAFKDYRAYPRMIICALACVLMVQVSYLKAIDWTNSGTATVLQTLNLLVVLALVCITGRRLPGKRESVGVALAFIGTVLIATGGDLTQLSLPLPGLLWGLTDAFCTSLMAFLPITLMAKYGNFTINGIMFVISGLVLIPFARPITAAPALDWFGIALVVFTIVGGTFGAYWLYLGGVQKAGAMRATMLGTSEPVTATISGVLFAGVVFTPTDWVGFAMIIVMVFLVR